MIVSFRKKRENPLYCGYGIKEDGRMAEYFKCPRCGYEKLETSSHSCQKCGERIEWVDCEKHYFKTISGRSVCLISPLETSISLFDIAYSLSNIYRFNGHLANNVSVLQHSIAAYVMCEDPLEKINCLMHDASEAYVHDIMSPLKNLLPDYIKIENNFQKLIGNVFSVNCSSETVKKIDSRLLEIEMESDFIGYTYSSSGRLIVNVCGKAHAIPFKNSTILYLSEEESYVLDNIKDPRTRLEILIFIQLIKN